MSDAKLIMELRKATGVGMMDCKKALEEAGDDFDKAVDILRKSGATKAAKKADRATSEGLVRLAVNEDNTKGSIVSIYCETDFVAKNADFISAVEELAKKGLSEDAEQSFEKIKDELILKIGENIQFGKAEMVDGNYVVGYIHSNNKIGSLVSFSDKIDSELANDIAMHIVAMAPKCISPEDVSQEDLEKEKEIYSEQLKSEGKPDDIIENIVKGKLNKYYEENCLMNQSFIKDDSKKISDLLGDAKILKFSLFSI